MSVTNNGANITKSTSSWSGPSIKRSAGHPGAGLAREDRQHGTKGGKGHPKMDTADSEQESVQEKRLSKENVRLRQEAEQIQQHISDLTEKLDELENTRTTKAEALLQEEQAQAHLPAQKVLIAELNAQLAGEAPSRLGSEVATITELKGELGEAQQLAKSRDKQVRNLKEQVKKLRLKLEVESARAALLSEQPGRVGINSASEAVSFSTANFLLQRARTIRLYEELTNVYLHGFKATKSVYGTDNFSFNCIYVHSDYANPDQSCTLNFELHIRQEPRAGTPYRPGVKLEEVLHYQPIDLDTMPNEIVKKLDRLAEHVSFDRNNLRLFVRTLKDQLQTNEDKEE
ncbi:hypothetical protein BKA70DRAFT_1444636 [Coprinopsis sp. MPI-PUGE-AT-0042]|nr:hypothetical protein BKA70DRAFT_1444636 [Coprinopsis sp. MPI-PUGE-AT-0042]